MGQCLHAQNGLVNTPHEDCHRGLMAVDLDNRETHGAATSIGVLPAPVVFHPRSGVRCRP